MNGKKEEESDIFKLVKMIMQRNFDPVRSQAWKIAGSFTCSKSFRNCAASVVIIQL